MTRSTGVGRGKHAASLANLETGRLDTTIHGLYSRSVQLYGVPLKKICPFKADCDCEGPDDQPCPALTARAAAKQAELETHGVGADTAAQIVRLDGQLLQAYSYLSKSGYVRIGKDDQTGQPILAPQPILTHVGVIENALARVLRDSGLNRALPGGGPLTPEALAKMHQEAKEAEEAEDAD